MKLQKKSKLEDLQKTTTVQLDEKVNEKANTKMESTIPNVVRSILVQSLKPNAFEKPAIQKEQTLPLQIIL